MVITVPLILAIAIKVALILDILMNGVPITQPVLLIDAILSKVNASTIMSTVSITIFVPMTCAIESSDVPIHKSAVTITRYVPSTLVILLLVANTLMYLVMMEINVLMTLATP
jgi:hypothetical protein